MGKTHILHVFFSVLSQTRSCPVFPSISIRDHGHQHHHTPGLQQAGQSCTFTGNSILPCCKIRWIDFYTDISLYIHQLCISVWIIVVYNHYSLLSLQCPLQAWWTNAQERELPRQLSNSSAWYLCFSVTLVTCQHGEPTEAALPLDSATNED